MSFSPEPPVSPLLPSKFNLPPTFYKKPFFTFQSLVKTPNLNTCYIFVIWHIVPGRFNYFLLWSCLSNYKEALKVRVLSWTLVPFMISRKKCHRMNVCALPPTHTQIRMLKPNPQCNGILGKWSLWEVSSSWGWSPHDGISALIKVSLLLCENTAKDSQLCTTKRVLTGPWICQHLHLGLLSLHNCEK